MTTARYTVQFHADSGNWSAPEGDDVRHANSKKEAMELLSGWADTVGRYDDPQCASALVWEGEHEDVTDLYPDWQLNVGPRGGVRWESV